MDIGGRKRRATIDRRRDAASNGDPDRVPPFLEDHHGLRSVQSIVVLTLAVETAATDCRNCGRELVYGDQVHRIYVKDNGYSVSLDARLVVEGSRVYLCVTCAGVATDLAERYVRDRGKQSADLMRAERPPKVRCSAIKHNGERCRNAAEPEVGVCGVHGPGGGPMTRDKGVASTTCVH